MQVREGDLAEEVEVVVHTDDNKQSQPVQETNVKTGPSVLQNVPFVESEPFISRTTLPISNNHKALQPTSSVRFDLDGHIYAVSRETQVAESQDATVVLYPIFFLIYVLLELLICLKTDNGNYCRGNTV